MRRAAKIDLNQPEIVEALRSVGVSVVSLASLGDGCPDLLASKKKADGSERAWLIEVKGPKGTLTDDQKRFILNWSGTVHIIRTPDEALKLVGEIE